MLNKSSFSSIQKRRLRKQRYNLIILRLKNLLRSPSVKVGSVLFGISIIFIILPYIFGVKPNFTEISQNIGFNLLGGVCAFIAFDIVFSRLKEVELQQGTRLDIFNKNEFIKTVYETNFFKNSINQTVSVRIMETWTELLRDKNYTGNFSQALLNSIEKNNAEVEILLLNPENKDLVEARLEELKSVSQEFSNINIEENIYTNLCEIQKIRDRLAVIGKENKLKVKLYNATPSLAIYMCAPNLFVTFFRSGKLSTMGNLLKLPIDSPVGAFINERFEEIWQDTRTIDLEDCLYLTVDVLQAGKFQNSYDMIKYVPYEQFYYIQNANLFKDIANMPDIHIKLNGKIFRPKNGALNDLPDNVRQIFCSKYPNCGELFIFLE